MSPNLLKKQAEWILRLECDELRMSPELSNELQACEVHFDHTPIPPDEQHPGKPTSVITGIAGKKCTLVPGMHPRCVAFFLNADTENHIATVMLGGRR